MKTALTFLFLGIYTCLFAQSPENDSLLNVLQTLPDDTVKVKVLNELANNYNLSDLEEAKKYALASVQLSEKLDNKNLQGFAQTVMGRTYVNLGVLDSAEYHLAIAQSVFEETGSLEGQSSVLDKLIFIANLQSNYEKSVELAFAGIEIQKKLKNNNSVAELYTEIARANYGLQKYDAAAEYGEKALELSSDNKVTRGYALDILSGIELQRENYSEALDYSNRALDLMKENGNPFDIAAFQNSRGNVYKKTEKYDKALADYIAVRNLLTEIGALQYVRSVNSNIGDVYNRKGRFAEALPINLQAYEEVKEAKGSSELIEACHHLSASYAGVGKTDSAYYYKDLQLENLEKLHAEESDRNQTELQTKYETQEKEALIREQASRLQFNSTLQKYFFGIGFLLILLAGLALYAFRNKQKSNRLLQNKNTEISTLLSEVHHRVKNNLQILSSLLYLQSRHIKDETALGAVKEGQNRVEAMGLIHQKLYTTENSATIEISEYLRDLGEMLSDSLIQDNRVRLNYDAPKKNLDVDTAVPLGLIINELVTNSLKYGFRDGREGRIDIKIAENEQKQLVLQVTDDGLGKHEQPTEKSTAFGSQLVQILCKKLKGKIVIPDTEKGYRTEIYFDNWK